MAARDGEAVKVGGWDVVQILECPWSGAAEVGAGFILSALAGEGVKIFAPAVGGDHRKVKDDILFGVEHFADDLLVKIAEFATGTAEGHAAPGWRGGGRWSGGEFHCVVTVTCPARRGAREE